MAEPQHNPAPAGGVPPPTVLEDLPVDELVHYGNELGLNLKSSMGRQELLRRVRERHALLRELPREALLDIVVWARRPVRRSASPEELAREIARVRRMDIRGLSHRGVVALARLRGVPARDGDPDELLLARMRAAEPLACRFERLRRRWMGSVISRLVNGAAGEDEHYRFLPEERETSLKRQIAEEGVVGGIARKLRGAADDYVREKLDEIEARIDRKLDEIDRRLAEWRDREIANRLRIIKITLAASVLVALVSLGYSLIRPR